MVQRRPSRNFPLGRAFFIKFSSERNYSIAEAYFRARGEVPEEFAELVDDFVPQPSDFIRSHRFKKQVFGTTQGYKSFRYTCCMPVNERRTIWIGGGKSKGTQVDQFAQGMKDYLDQAFVIEKCPMSFIAHLRTMEFQFQMLHLPEAVEGRILPLSQRRMSFSAQDLQASINFKIMRIEEISLIRLFSI